MDENNSNNPKDVEYGLREEDYYDVVSANMERRKTERENKKKKKIHFKPILIILGFAALIGLFAFSLTDYFVVDNIEVEGNSYFSDEEIITMAHAVPGNNIIYRPGKKSIKDYLKKNTYIESVKVVRKFPSTLVIKVGERTQLGAIVYDDDYLIIDGKGILLRKTKTQPKITILSGIKVKKLALGEPLETDNDRVFDDVLNLLNTMESTDIFFTKIEMSDMYIRAYIYDYLICKGTYEQLESGMETGRLHKILKNLFDKGIKRGTITFSDDGYASFNPAIS